MHFIDSIIRFVKNEEGAAAIEYALMAVMVAVVIVAFVPDIQNAVRGIFTTVQTGLEDATP